jgi:hypothetical protein
MATDYTNGPHRPERGPRQGNNPGPEAGLVAQNKAANVQHEMNQEALACAGATEAFSQADAQNKTNAQQSARDRAELRQDFKAAGQEATATRQDQVSPEQARNASPSELQKQTAVAYSAQITGQPLNLDHLQHLQQSPTQVQSSPQQSPADSRHEQQQSPAVERPEAGHQAEWDKLQTGQARPPQTAVSEKAFAADLAKQQRIEERARQLEAQWAQDQARDLGHDR